MGGGQKEQATRRGVGSDGGAEERAGEMRLGADQSAAAGPAGLCFRSTAQAREGASEARRHVRAGEDGVEAAAERFGVTGEATVSAGVRAANVQNGRGVTGGDEGTLQGQADPVFPVLAEGQGGQEATGP